MTFNLKCAPPQIVFLLVDLRTKLKNECRFHSRLILRCPLSYRVSSGSKDQWRFPWRGWHCHHLSHSSLRWLGVGPYQVSGERPQTRPESSKQTQQVSCKIWKINIRMKNSLFKRRTCRFKYTETRNNMNHLKKKKFCNGKTPLNFLYFT